MRPKIADLGGGFAPDGGAGLSTRWALFWPNANADHGGVDDRISGDVYCRGAFRPRPSTGHDGAVWVGYLLFMALRTGTLAAGLPYLDRLVQQAQIRARNKARNRDEGVGPFVKRLSPHLSQKHFQTDSAARPARPGSPLNRPSMCRVMAPKGTPALSWLSIRVKAFNHLMTAAHAIAQNPRVCIGLPPQHDTIEAWIRRKGFQAAVENDCEIGPPLF